MQTVSTSNEWHSRCNFGIAVGDITPPPGIYHRMWGAARHDRATGVHRPLRATVIGLQPIGGEHPTTCQLIGLIDHCMLGSAELDRIMELAKRSIREFDSQLHVVCSHTHAAGLMSLSRTHLPGGELIPGYLDQLGTELGSLASEVCRDLRPATITYRYGHSALAAHRDYWDEQDERYVCGFNPNGKADDTLLVAKIADGSGTPLATLVNYACHPTTLAWDNSLISPDYPGAMRETLEQQLGVPAIFLQGASGDLGPHEGFVGDVDLADRNGRQLAYAALATLESLPWGGENLVYSGAVESGAAIGTWRRATATNADQRAWARHAEWSGTIPLPYRSDLQPTNQIEREAAEAERSLAAAVSQGDSEHVALYRALHERKARELTRRATLPAGDTFPWRANLQMWGDAIWVLVQGEPYCYLQTQLRQAFPSHPIVVGSLAYDWSLGYLPTRDCYGRDLYQQNIAVVAPGSLEQGVDQLVRQIDSLLGSA